MAPDLELAHLQRRLAYLDHEAAIMRIYGEHSEAKIYESSANAIRGLVEHIKSEQR